jgi:hypothetical protein
MKELRIEVSSDLDYEGMVIDIIYLNNLLAKLDCDQGLDKTQIHFFGKDGEDPIWKLEYSSFNEVLDKAFQKLKEANNIS